MTTWSNIVEDSGFPVCISKKRLKVEASALTQAGAKDASQSSGWGLPSSSSAEQMPADPGPLPWNISSSPRTRHEALGESPVLGL